MIAVLTGGTGGAKFVDGLRHILPPEDLTIIVNTGDDFECWGLRISPDLDSITYMLAGLLSKERGWGVGGDTFECLEAMRRLGQPAWFQIGDRDLATHLMRTQWLHGGQTLTEATAEIVRRLGIPSRILPMSDSPVETRITTQDGEISFQEYFVLRRFRDAVKSVRFAGAEDAAPAPGVVEAIVSAEAVLVAPSNPITSIGPILAIPGIHQALQKTGAPVVAVSPIVGAAPVSGPAGALMSAQGFPVSIAGVAQAYEDFLDTLVADVSDQALAGTLPAGVEVHFTNILMKTAEDRVHLAKAVRAASESSDRALSRA
ncbi:MAG TPA: 2-phospho-L-lactate transferase [Terriglobales bacterium]